jgi:hypothetical protein
MIWDNEAMTGIQFVTDAKGRKVGVLIEWDNQAMTGIQFVTDAKGRKVGVLIDLKKHRAVWEDFWDGLVSESRGKEKALPYEQYRATRPKRPSRRA